MLQLVRLGLGPTAIDLAIDGRGLVRRRDAGERHRFGAPLFVPTFDFRHAVGDLLDRGNQSGDRRQVVHAQVHGEAVGLFAGLEPHRRLGAGLSQLGHRFAHAVGYLARRKLHILDGELHRSRYVHHGQFAGRLGQRFQGFLQRAAFERAGTLPGGAHGRIDQIGTQRQDGDLAGLVHAPEELCWFGRVKSNRPPVGCVSSTTILADRIAERRI